MGFARVLIIEKGNTVEPMFYLIFNTNLDGFGWLSRL